MRSYKIDGWGNRCLSPELSSNVMVSFFMFLHFYSYTTLYLFFSFSLPISEACESKSVSRSVLSDPLRPHALHVVCRAPLSMEFSRQEYWSSHSLLQGIFLTQRLNPGLPHCRQILYHLRHQGSPKQCKILWIIWIKMYCFL